MVAPRNSKPSGELRHIFGPARGALWAIALFSVAVNVLLLTGPLFMLQVYDRVIGSRSSSTLLVLFLIVGFLFTVMGLLDYFRGRILARIGAQLVERLDARIMRATLERTASATYRNQPATGATELSRINALFGSPALGAVFDLPFTPIFVALLFFFHPLMGWFAIASSVIVFTLAVLNQRYTHAAHAEANRAAAEAEMRSTVMRSGLETLRGLGMSRQMLDRWQNARDRALLHGMKAADRSGGFTQATKAFRMFIQSAMLALGAWLVLQNMLTAGAMIAGSVLLGRALAPVEQTVGQWAAIQNAWNARKSLSRLLDETPEKEAPMSLPRPKPELTVSDILVAPPGSRTPTLHQLSFEAVAGDAIAVIGVSASGKSTLARALVGLWPTLHGEIRLGGAALAHFDREALGRLLGYLPQEVTFFAGTVAENIARFTPNADPKDIVYAAQTAAAHELILSLPQGYDTPLSDGAPELSGGQRQRIGLARAIFGNPILLVLDEPNSSLDDAGTKALNQSISIARKQGQITLVMSHRPSALAHCNKVLLLDKGQIRAFGPRDEVLRSHVKNASNFVRPKAVGEN
ncbi:type I secretion system permease/ATPase (plasmid) [Thioclava litoralis]|uniref:Type I secretion system permease/ATPase n=1 Tax=Thioclava litoralis TaxID=3076557 RepID=A0ABZ1E346_9RHOB|nr:type I secretion system permease/ATPase [Thioclava sp. FTW29]